MTRRMEPMMPVDGVDLHNNPVPVSCIWIARPARSGHEEGTPMSSTAGERKRRGYRRALRWSLLLLAFVLIVPLIPYGLATAESTLRSPGGDLWRAVRGTEQAEMIRSQVGGPESTVLINEQGETWRQFRDTQLVPYGGWLLLGTLALITRVIHWFAASQFVILGVTGLVLLYGKYVLIPLLGPQGFGITASACKEVHNLFGPIFPFAILALIVLFGRGNVFKWIDIKWFFKAGGLFGGKMADSGYYNGGQKSWFWMTVLFGIAISVSGLVLDFPVFGQTRELMTFAHLVHGIVAVVFIAASFGHIYIGTLGMEGAVESMTTGYVDAHWAAEHHNLWYAEMEKAGMVGVEPNALEEVKRHDDIDFKGFGAPTADSKEG
jgi:formate dehydrogenase subunit gamma